MSDIADLAAAVKSLAIVGEELCNQIYLLRCELQNQERGRDMIKSNLAVLALDENDIDYLEEIGKLHKAISTEEAQGVSQE